MNENYINSLKRLKEISKTIESTLQQNNRLKSILASEMYFRKKCEASIETIENTTDKQECFRKVSKIFIRKSRDEIKKELNEEIAHYDKHTPHLVDLRKKLIDKLSNLKEQYLETHEYIEREANSAS
ncbi:mediator of RNA polymerase II transcription subunit 11 [Plasmodium brasilianum]|uniref:Mediator of RNA polymerase II transcription subunit 11 n=1 Tax=Plasmodium brasilianum TaxID=5824 RepID=A0ACB9YBX3_PLABR|nr:mediator of RNA polymerase II transcription subunit 11 [Plasmodium brasilianum]